ncbi:hypothetical protein [Sutcliffiella horikoshii]|uniref:capsular polysaccharide export protein, LipB/KpsS family n=1 Tax=Sutcliffiella horikoshii TaxID=79883 RepID=UPI003CF7647F
MKKVKRYLKKLKKILSNDVKVKTKPYIEIGENWSDSKKPIAYMFGFNPWKREHISSFLPEYRTAYVFGGASINRLTPFMEKGKEKVFVFWGYKEERETLKYAQSNNIKVLRAEDGFLRSVGLGAGHSLPMSIVFDEKGLYFNSESTSDLEEILETYNIADNSSLMNRSKEGIRKLLETRLSKYNHVQSKSISSIYGVKTRKRILVIGQVESDASIKFGCNRNFTNNDLVRAAYLENPDSEIIYKPHPDVLTGHREKVSDPNEVSSICKIITEEVSLVDSLDTIDHVYTITSLAGFEALLRGIKVTCFGAPFYSGWGLTDDRQRSARRTKSLTIEELFAGTYLIYPKYLDLTTKKLITFEEALKNLTAQVELNRKQIELDYKKELLNKKKKGKEPYVQVGDWTNNEKSIAFMFGFNPWKREHISAFFPEYRTAFVYGSADIDRLMPYLIDEENIVFIVWGFKETDEIRKYAKKEKIKLIRTEDGFVRSVGLGAGHSLPMSIVADDKTLYFNSREPSRLEEILQTYDFKRDTVLLEKAKKSMDLLINKGISKYNHVAPTDVEKIYGPKKKKRILVVGQVETDASIKYGCNREMTNNDLVWAAYNENPDAEIIYKPHPDVLTGFRDAVTDPMAVSHIAKVVTDPISLIDSFNTIDHVYTITSLSGFEALLRGIEVTCFGLPFYAGWGLTNDKQVTNRRNRKLTLIEVFAGTYLLYPRYINLETQKLVDCEETILNLLSKKADQLYQEALEAFECNDLITSENLVVKSIGMDDTNYKSLILFGDIKVKLCLDSEALHYYNKAIELAPDKLTKGNIYKKIVRRLFNGTIDNYSKTKEYIKNALDQTNHFELKVMYLKLLRKYEGINEEALLLIEELIKLDKSGDYSNLFSSILNEAGYYEKALQLSLNTAIQDEELKSIPYMRLKALLQKKRPELFYENDNYVYYCERLNQVQGNFKELILKENKEMYVILDESNPTLQMEKEIDDAKLVIRFNNFNIDYPNKKYTGSKTDIWVKQPRCNLQSNIPKELKLVVISEPNFDHQHNHGSDVASDFIDNDISLEIAPKYIFLELVSKINKEPSEELLILYWIYKIQGPISESNIIGLRKADEDDKKVIDLYKEILC